MTKTIFHGSKTIVRSPRFGIGSTYNDFGLGFYCTENAAAAREWAVGMKDSGFVNIYSINTDGLRIIDLTNPRFSAYHWLSVLLSYREFDAPTSKVYRAKDQIQSSYSVDLQNCDCIIGYRADDSSFSFAQDYLNGDISYEELCRALISADSAKQFVLKSNRAFDRITFTGYESCLSQVYYPSRAAKDRRARSAYGVPYIRSAMRILGRMLDFSVNTLKLGAGTILDLFVTTGISERFERGDPRLLAGLSGIELSYEILRRSGISFEGARFRYFRASDEYRAGAALAYYQKESGLSFADIMSKITAAEIISISRQCHEKTRPAAGSSGDSKYDWMNPLGTDPDSADYLDPAEDFLEAFTSQMKARRNAVPEASLNMTKLKEMRIRSGYSQSGLAAVSRVPVRTIQQYEQRQKNINKAQAEYIAALAGALSCRYEDILER